MPELPLLVPFLAGLASSLHCVGMCGPLALAAGGTGGPRLGPLLYLVGKTGSYLFLGACLAFGGGVVGVLVSPQVLRAVLGLTGLYFLVHGLEMIRPGFLVGSWTARIGVPEGVKGLLRKLRQGGGPAALAIGTLSGLLPCPVSWGMAAWAAGTGSPLSGGVIMISFGLGTAPGLLLVSRLAGWSGTGKRPALRVLSGVTWVGIGLHLLSNCW